MEVRRFFKNTLKEIHRDTFFTLGSPQLAACSGQRPGSNTRTNPSCNPCYNGDRQRQRLTPSEGEVRKVQDPALLSQVKTRDRVRFTVDKIKGAYMVMALEPVQ